MTCRHDPTSGDYLLPSGEQCTHDEWGDPTYHCTARRTCSQHVGPRELTCARCISRARANVTQIVNLAALVLPTALGDGVNSEAANLAGPAADPRRVDDIREAVRHRVQTGLMAGTLSDEKAMRILTDLPEHDDRHPMTLARWQVMLAEDWEHPLPRRLTVTGAADYLDRHLTKFAQDEDQDFPLFAREVRKVRRTLEDAIHDGEHAERGVPCPECGIEDRYERLVRQFGHWCEDPDCERVHYDDASGDRWRCRYGHTWWHDDYQRLEERVS